MPLVLSGTSGVPASSLNGVIPDANAPSGSVIQVVQGSTATEVSTNTRNVYIDTGLSATITPTSASNRILVLVNQVYWQSNPSGATIYGHIRLLRNNTQIMSPSASENVVGGSINEFGFRQSWSVVDSPNTTSALTYKTQGWIQEPSGSLLIINRNSSTATIILMEIAA